MVDLTDSGEVFAGYKEYHLTIDDPGGTIPITFPLPKTYLPIDRLIFNYTASWVGSPHEFSPPYPLYIELIYYTWELETAGGVGTAVSPFAAQVEIIFDPPFDFANVNTGLSAYFALWTDYADFTLHSILTADDCAVWTNLVNCEQRC